jgi:hypothetical protein
VARISAKHFLAFEIESAAVTLARHAVEIENRWAPLAAGIERVERERILREVQHYVISAVIVAVAGLEAMVNEFLDRDDLSLRLQKHSTALIESNDNKLWHLAPAAIQQLLALPPTRKIEGNALEKLQLILETAGLPAIPAGHGPGQQLSALIELRNALVHHVPIARPHGRNLTQNERDSLENTLRGKFKLSTLVDDSYTFIWNRCLSADCARWAVLTVERADNEFRIRLGSSICSALTVEEVRGQPPKRTQ